MVNAPNYGEKRVIWGQRSLFLDVNHSQQGEKRVKRFPAIVPSRRLHLWESGTGNDLSASSPVLILAFVLQVRDFSFKRLDASAKGFESCLLEGLGAVVQGFDDGIKAIHYSRL